jgi:hypothetical protein
MAIFSLAVHGQQVNPEPTNRLREVVSKVGEIHAEVRASRLFEPVVVTINFRNSSDQEMLLADWDLATTYGFEVRDEKGNLVEKTPKGEVLYEGDGIRGMRVVLQPGESARPVEVRLDLYYRFTRGGTYTVSVRRRIYTNRNVMEYAYSDKVNFTIKP